MNIRLTSTALSLMLGLSACAGTSPQVASLHDQPIPGAHTIEAPVAGPAVLNSDNQPAGRRTGLNSDPNNPNGVPGGSGTTIY